MIAHLEPKVCAPLSMTQQMSVRDAFPKSLEMEAYKLDSKKRCIRKDVQAMVEQLSSILEQFPLLQKDLQLSEELLRTSASIQSILSQSNHLEETHSSTLGRSRPPLPRAKTWAGAS